MEEVSEDKDDAPPVPIPTYLWEDLRRSKSKGFYPWTHVFKPPFDEDVWLRENVAVDFKKGSGKKRSLLALGFLKRISLGDGWERCSRSVTREKGGGARVLFPRTSSAGGDETKSETEASLLMQRSRSASSSSVRCGCQYFQSTDPLPERRSLVGTPPLSRTPTMGDHEYEPINPIEPPPPAVVADAEIEVPRAPTPTVFERRYIKIPNEDAIIIPLHGDSDEEINPDRYEDKSLVQEVQEVPKQVQFNEPEERPPPMITISQPDSPEPLPLDKTARGMRTRLKSQAGEFRDKLRKISTPKISLPERPKIKMPDRPKINFPDRPQFLKEKPKFLTERPKFLSEKPKFLSERPKFLTEKPKFLRERPKFNIDRSKFKIPEGLFERHKKGPKQKRPNPSSLRRPLRDTVTVTSSDSSRKFFETLKFRSYPRFLSRKKREQELKQMGSLDTESSPSTPPSRRKADTQWVETFTETKFADEDPKMDTQEEDYEESTTHFRDTYVRGALLLGADDAMKAKIDSLSDVESDKEQHSSGSESMRRRAGVLEEIDSDEFFLRQKGLSREDMDVSRYLSKEIRDAFRSPKNALAHMDSTDYDDDGGSEMRFEEPKPPERKKSIKSVQSEKIDGFNTFPSRPSRRKQSEPDFGSKEEFEVRKPPRKYRSKSASRQRSTPSLARSRSQGMDVREETPSAPKRRSKSSKSLSRSMHESMGEIQVEDVHREIGARDHYREPHVPFRKSRSRCTSLADEDRTSRGADSADLPHDDRFFHEEEEVVTAMPALVRAPTEDSFGYAIVHKEPKKAIPPRPPPPSRHKRQLHQLQSQLHTIKNHGVNFFFTYPRRAIKSLHKTPVRPIRNYSTLGPSRPPRRNRVFREPVYVDGDDDVEIIEVQNEKHEELKDLQSGAVVERIQGRPLPAPPRPPRKSKDEDFLTSEQSETYKDDESKEAEKSNEKILEMMNTSQQTSFEVAEVSVSIQTDPLPEDYVVDDNLEVVSQRSAVSKTPTTMYRESSIEQEFIRRQEESREDTPPPLPERSLPSLLRNLPTFPVSFPDRLHLTELEVDKLNVNELQASKLQVSDMETTSLQVKELNSQGGNLVVNGIELPPDFFKNLAAQFPVRESPQAVPQLRRVLTPPPPIIVQHVPTTNEVAQPHPSQASTTDQLPKPKTTKSRGRKSPTRVIDDSEDELASVLPEREKIEREKLNVKPSTSQPRNSTEPSAFDLAKQLLAIWIRNVYQGTGSLIEGINSMFPEGEKRRDAQVAAVILVVIISALILIGFGYDNSVHHHHWDYLPPR